MSTRILIAAVLMTATCAAQADVLPTTGSDSTSLVKALYGTSSADQAGAASLKLAQGIDGTYVIGTSNTIMAAMLGYGMSVFGKQAVTQPVTQTVATTAPVVSRAEAPATTTPVTATTPTASVDIVTGGDVVADIGQDAGIGAGVGAGIGLDINTPAADAPLADAEAAEVPEPSSIALMMAGMMGALALGRRRRRG